MIAKQIVRSVLLVVVLGSLAIWANREYQKSQATAAPAAAETLPVVAGRPGHHDLLHFRHPL